LFSQVGLVTTSGVVVGCTVEKSTVTVEVQTGVPVVALVNIVKVKSATTSTSKVCWRRAYSDAVAVVGVSVALMRTRTQSRTLGQLVPGGSTLRVATMESNAALFAATTAALATAAAEPAASSATMRFK